MIISASYKTDIPTFYGEWFMNRLRAGFCKMVNPYNRKAIRVSLNRNDVDGIVFWTKNVAPFVKHLNEVREREFPFVLQHTINAYPRTLEQSVVDSARSVDAFKRVSETHGPRTCVWRYDTVVMSSETPREWHLDSFARIASELRGFTDEVVISFVHFYQKTLRNMNAAAEEFGFEWYEPELTEKRTLLSQFVDIATENGMKLSICAQRELIVEGAYDAKCVDADRLIEIAGEDFRSKQKGNRKECGCFASRDIGEYDTCPHGCVYCYAVRNKKLALERFREHDPEGEFLFKQSGVKDTTADSRQGRLFE
ncbi:DUF1848 domain-containing protein [Stieleria varia]|uniref:DUF1848 domain-containing protein n=1 Tax=Stieleria varia TaxID=2528005 RepID=A0A5C6AS45_9BACT|nr:DUF1848 domain-containing protein [Stieleria varia]TWU02863.1 hypothetical protein Pla52n_39230 [Stieleria varia]